MAVAVATPGRPRIAGRTRASERHRERAEATAERQRSGGVTLEDVVLRAWEGLSARGLADCPVCGDAMRALCGCRACGAHLS